MGAGTGGKAKGNGPAPGGGRRALRWAAALLLASAAGCGWWAPSPPGPAFADDALADYLPEEAGAVYALNQREARASSTGQRLLGSLRQLLDKEKVYQPWMGLAGADPVRDVDEARFVFCPPDLDRPLLLLRGRFDPGRFQVGPGKLREGSDGPFRFDELPGPKGRVTHLARVGGFLAVCDSRPRFLAALTYAADRRPIRLQDRRLGELLAEVDRGQGVWLAVSLGKLGPIPRLTNRGLELVLRPLLSHAEGVQGGLSCGDDEVRAAFFFRARTEADAADLETALQSSCQLAQGARVLPGIDRELLPLLDLFGTGVVRRDGAAVEVRCRLPADRLGP
jgi:hypothetical protein